MLAVFGRGLPDHTHLLHYEPPVLSRIYTADVQLLHEYAKEKRLFVPLHLIPKRIQEAFLAAEDRHFYEHFGIDVVGMGRAILMNTLSGAWGKNPGGASTITQQVAKNFLVGNERSFDRKIKEAILSFRLEYSLPKDRLLELYLNQIYLGAGTYGVAAAALVYFDKELDALTIEEAAFLAALPKAPSRLTQGSHLARLKQRRDWIIDYLMTEGKIPLAEGEKAKRQSISFGHHREKKVVANYFLDEVRHHVVDKVGKKSFQQGGLTIRTTLEPDLQKMADDALKEGLVAYDRRHGWRGPLTHVSLEEWVAEGHTLEEWFFLLEKIKKRQGKILGKGTYHLAIVLHVKKKEAIVGVDDGSEQGSLGVIPLKKTLWAAPSLPKQQVGPAPQEMEEVLHKGDIVFVSAEEESSADSKKVPSGKIKKKYYNLEQVPLVTGGILVMEPQSGRILALSGGYDYEIRQFNCVTQAYRQPGSCFKPFVYLAGLEKGLTPETEVLDAPVNISLGEGLGVYSPKNYTNKYFGMTSLQVGLEQSHNAMTVRLAQDVGLNSIISLTQRFGIMDKVPKQMGVVLGAGSTTLWRLTTAYATLANKGVPVKPYLINWIQNRYGDVLYDHQREETEGMNAFSSVSPAVASSASVTELTNMLVGVTQRGTARSLRQLPFPIAGKTGTTNGYMDAWFVGYTRNLVVGVFVGFPQPRTLGEGEGGGRVAVPIAKKFLQQAYQDKEKPFFEDYVLSFNEEGDEHYQKKTDGGRYDVIVEEVVE